MSATIESEQQTPNPPLANLVSTISSYDGNVLLAAIISLLLVILFVLLLHLYAKWFLAHARQRSRSSSTLSHVFPHDRFRHFHAFSFDNNPSASSPSKGLDPSLISSIPLFVFKLDEHSSSNNIKKHGLHNLDCVVCLSPFEDNDVGRNLPKCGHGFHLECIDMWLYSHSNCPICRAPVLSTNDAESQVSSSETVGESLDSGRHHQIAAPIYDDDDDDDLSASSSIGCSLKRMLSRNRSESKVFPTSNGGDLQV